MSDFSNRERIENRLRLELEEAQAQLVNATPEEKPAAQKRHREALRRFRDFVFDGKVEGE